MQKNLKNCIKVPASLKLSTDPFKYIMHALKKKKKSAKAGERPIKIDQSEKLSELKWTYK